MGNGNEIAVIYRMVKEGLTNVGISEQRPTERKG